MARKGKPQDQDSQRAVDDRSARKQICFSNEKFGQIERRYYSWGEDEEMEVEGYGQMDHGEEEDDVENEDLGVEVKAAAAGLTMAVTPLKSEANLNRGSQSSWRLTVGGTN